MRQELLTSPVHKFRQTLGRVPDNVYQDLFRIGKDATLPTESTSDDLKPNTQVLVDSILKQLEVENPDLLECLTRIIGLFETSGQHEYSPNDVELFIAGAFIMHEILRQTRGKVGPITNEPMSALFKSMFRPNGIRMTIDDAEAMIAADGNKKLIFYLLNTFTTIPVSRHPGKKHNKRSSFGRGCKIMYWLWYTQAQKKKA